MSRRIENTFSVSAPIERVWKAMTDPEELNRWYFPFRIAEDGSTRTEVLGVERASEVLELEPLRRFRLRTAHTGREGWPPVLPGTREMAVDVEGTDAGTRVTITHSGFGEGEDWEQVLAATRRGAEETLADFVLYLETGVGVRRHPAMGASFHGIGAREVLAGLEVRSVQPGTFADRLGLTAGDLLVELGGAAVFGFRELLFFTREHGPGEAVEAAWVRGGQLLRGSAELGPRRYAAPPVATAWAQR